MKSIYVCFLTFILLPLYTQTTQHHFRTHDTCIYKPYEQQKHTITPSWEYSRPYHIIQAIQTSNRSKEQARPKKTKPDNEQQENIFFRAFAWVGEHIADGVDYILGENESPPPPQSKVPVSKKQPPKNSLHSNTAKPSQASLKQYDKATNPNIPNYYDGIICDYQEDIICGQEAYTHEHKRKKDRLQALQETIASPNYRYEKQYELSSNLTNALHSLDIPLEDWNTLYGTPFQQQLHQEFIEITDQTNTIKFSSSQEQTLASSIFAFSHAGILHNQAELVLQAAYTADLCWSFIDCCKGVVEGIGDIAEHLKAYAHNPTKAAKECAYSFAYPFIQAGHALSKVLRCMDDLGYIQFLKYIDTDLAQAEHEKFQQRLIAFDDRIQEKIKAFNNAWPMLKQLSARDIARHGTSIGIEIFLTKKSLDAVGTLSRIARVQAIATAKKITDKTLLSLQTVAITAEGMEMPIVAESLHFLSETQKSVGSSIGKIQKPLSTLQSKFKVAIEGIEEIIPEVTKLNGDKISHILQPKHVWGRLVHNEKNWDAVARIISKAMKEGTLIDTQSRALHKILKIEKEAIEVTFVINEQGIHIGNAWIKR